MTDENIEYGINLSPGPDYIHNNWGRALAAAGLLSLVKVPGLINPDLNVRDILPEPFDFPDHLGNIGGMALFAFPALQGWLKGSNEHATTREWFDQDRKRTAKIIGAFTVAANVIGEAIGYGSTSTPDPIDFAYGLVGGYLFYRASKPEFLPETEIDRIHEAVDYLKAHDALGGSRQEIGDRFGLYKRKINDLRLKLETKNRQTKQSTVPAPKTSQNNKPTHNKRYTPPKKRR